MDPREPKQARSKETVAQILDAAEALLTEETPQKLQMRAVAKKAGVGQGTLYDYFPTPKALLESLEMRAWQRFVERLCDTIVTLHGQDVELIVRRVVEITTKEMFLPTRIYGLRPDPEHWLSKRAALVRQFVDFAVQRLEARGARLASPDPHMALTMATYAVTSLMHVGTQYYPKDYASGRFTRELVDLVVRYLVVSPQRAAENGPESGVSATSAATDVAVPA